MPQLATKTIEYIEQTPILGYVGIRNTWTMTSVGGTLYVQRTRQMRRHASTSLETQHTVSKTSMQMAGQAHLDSGWLGARKPAGFE
jgi:hypothetical protein